MVVVGLDKIMGCLFSIDEHLINWFTVLSIGIFIFGNFTLIVFWMAYYNVASFAAALFLVFDLLHFFPDSVFKVWIKNQLHDSLHTFYRLLLQKSLREKMSKKTKSLTREMTEIAELISGWSVKYFSSSSLLSTFASCSLDLLWQESSMLSEK